MPFLGKDWRDPGSEWIKSSNGHWERTKIWRLRLFELLNDKMMKRMYRQSIGEDGMSSSRWSNDFDMVEDSDRAFYQPHAFVKTWQTRENANTTTLSEVLLQLDMSMAIHDMRRFSYVCKILHILIKYKLHMIAGRTQIYIIDLLKEVLKQVLTSRNCTGVMRQLLADLRASLKENKYEHIGSSRLWQNHLDALDEMSKALEAPELQVTIDPVAHRPLPNRRIPSQDSISSSPLSVSPSPLSSSPVVALESLPPECLLQILEHVTCPQDLAMAGEASPTLGRLVNSELLWKHLVIYHFSRQQLASIMMMRRRPVYLPGVDRVEAGAAMDNLAYSLDDCNWQHVYSRLLKRYGDRHFYPVKLNFCENCACVFWPIFGHPCHISDVPIKVRALSPEEFVGLFQI